jgi:hypothetical protein
MDEEVRRIFKFSGHMFTIVATILFYNHLFVAASNPGFQVQVYFNFYGEGLIELFLFLCFIPFIVFAFILEIKDIRNLRRKKK